MGCRKLDKGERAHKASEHKRRSAPTVVVETFLYRNRLKAPVALLGGQIVFTCYLIHLQLFALMLSEKLDDTALFMSVPFLL